MKYQLKNVPISFMPVPTNQNEIFTPMNDIYYKGIKPYYLISTFGRVFNIFTNKFVKVYLGGNTNNDRFISNFQFELPDGSTKEKRIFVHRAMMISFCYRDDCDRLEVDHVDGVWYHNYLANLEWVTKEENIRRAHNLGLIKPTNYYTDESCRADYDRKIEDYRKYNFPFPKPLYQDEAFMTITDIVIPNIEDNRYMLSNYGRVFDCKLNLFVVGIFDYYSWNITMNLSCKNNTEVSILLADLMARAFYMQTAEYARMIDRQTKTLYHANNIEWTDLDKDVHEMDKNLKFVNGQRVRCGEGSSFPTKLNEEKVHKICKLLEENQLTLQQIADKFFVSMDSIYRIKKGDNWKHISCNYNLPKTVPRGERKGELNVTSKYTEAQIRQICELLEQHKYSNKEIAKMLNIPDHIVSQVKNFRTWPHIAKEYNF